MRQLTLVTLHIGRKTGEEVLKEIEDMDVKRIHDVKAFAVSYYCGSNDGDLIVREITEMLNVLSSKAVIERLTENHLVVHVDVDGDVRCSSGDHTMASRMFR